jgi:hypothetical protein
MLERYAGGRIEVFELIKWYRDRLAANAVADLPSNWWAYGCYADGKPIKDAHRLIYRKRRDLRERFPDPFAAGEGTFAEWLAEQDCS